jgi:hypothetical protein
VSNDSRKTTASRSRSLSTTEPKTFPENPRPAKSPEAPIRTTGPEVDHTTKQARSIPDGDITSEALPSVVLATDEENAVSEQMLQDLMPDLELPSIDYDMRLSAFDTQVDLQKSDGYPFDFIDSPTQRNLSLNTLGSLVKLNRMLLVQSR